MHMVPFGLEVSSARAANRSTGGPPNTPSQGRARVRRPARGIGRAVAPYWVVTAPLGCMSPMREHQRIVEAAARWAKCDDRVRALLLKGSLARGEADERSDVDFVVVAKRGQLASLWEARDAIAGGLGGWLGGFDEVAWQEWRGERIFRERFFYDPTRITA